MSEPQLISPLLDNYVMGDPISDHNGVRCCPAMENESENKYIVKIISIPASQSQLDALLLSGAYSDQDSALAYFKTLADGILDEANALQRLTQLEGFLSFEGWQIVPMDDGVGYDIYLTSAFRRTLQKHLQRTPMTHLAALNLGLDLCAALSVCRRMGYLYVNLKPENIYLTDDNEFRIGDLGFLKLDSLKYASLPDRYRSAYTAPEIEDAYSALNSTIDVYALGLILYQVFNDGKLPQVDESGVLQPPVYADYEMSEIILKACAQNPDERWQDPVTFGQALVSYMQRNGAHDTPIVPQVVLEENTVEETGVFEQKTGEDESGANENVDAVEETSEEAKNTEITEESIFTEDAEGNLTLIEDNCEDSAGQEETVELDYEEVTEEVTEILNQADELIAHPTPEPVVQPEPIEVSVPPIAEEDPSEESAASEENENCAEDNKDTTDAEDCDTSEQVKSEAADEEAQEEPIESEVADEATAENDDPEPQEFEDQGRKTKTWVIGCVIAVLTLALLVAGIFFYKNFYLQPIDDLYASECLNGELTVYVATSIDDSKLSIVCTDTYGNPLSSPVVNGQAQFTGLAPGSVYTIHVTINGFHRLTGETSITVTTPKETKIVQFEAKTGSEDGSAILNFAIDGPDAEQWILTYSSANQAEQKVTFTGHTVTVSGLNIGSKYNFALKPDADTPYSGSTKLTHTASSVIKAQDLQITGCVNGKLTAKWSVPTGATVSEWTVRCYNDSGYEKTISVSDTSVEFEDIDPTLRHTVEVTAKGMSVSEPAIMEPNSITVSDFTATPSGHTLVLSWTPESTVNGWVLYYTIDNSAKQEVTSITDNTYIFNTVVPGAEHVFTLQCADGSAVLGGVLKYTPPKAESFTCDYEDYYVTADQMEFRMCYTPSYADWDRYDISQDDYTSEFAIGEKGSFLVYLDTPYGVSQEEIQTLYVIRDKDNTIVIIEEETRTWVSMWYRRYGEFDIPSLPQTAGEYTISVYFNGALAHTQAFTITG